MVCQTFLCQLLMVRNPSSVPGCLVEDAKMVVSHMGENPFTGGYLLTFILAAACAATWWGAPKKVKLIRGRLRFCGKTSR